MLSIPGIHFLKILMYKSILIWRKNNRVIFVCTWKVLLKHKYVFCSFEITFSHKYLFSTFSVLDFYHFDAFPHIPSHRLTYICFRLYLNIFLILYISHINISIQIRYNWNIFWYRLILLNKISCVDIFQHFQHCEVRTSWTFWRRRPGVAFARNCFQFNF